MFKKNNISENKAENIKEKTRVSEATKKRDRLLSLPKQLLVGFYANIKPVDLEKYLYAKANSNMLPHNSYYGIKKFENGYLWELQEGGSGKGVLSSIVEKLKSTDDIIIETADRPVRIMRKSSGEGISAFILNDDDKVTATEGVAYKDRLKSVKNTGYGAFMVSLVFCLVGVLSASSTLIFKYGLFKQPEPLKFVIKNEQLPVMQMDQLQYVLESENVYLKQLTYKKGKDWSMDRQVEKVKPKDKDEALKAINEQVSKAAEMLNIQDNEAGDNNE